MKRNKKFLKRKELRKLVKKVNSFGWNIKPIGFERSSKYGYELYIGLNSQGEQLLDKENLKKAIELVSKPKYSNNREHSEKIRTLTGQINCTRSISEKEYINLPHLLKYYFRKKIQSDIWSFLYKEEPKTVYILRPDFIHFVEIKVRKGIRTFYDHTISREEAELNRKAKVINLFKEASKEMGWSHHRKEIDSCKHSKVNKILKSEYKKEVEDTLTKEE